MTTEIAPKGEAELLRVARDKFAATFRRSPVAAAAAPGRVNFIGDHVDYCEGFVLPVALPFITLVVGGYNNSDTINIVSVLTSGEELETSFQVPTADLPLKPGEPAWANYVKGVLANFPGELKGFDAVIVSDVPMGSGLSSSASIEVAVFTFLEALTGVKVNPVEKAKLCQRAEHDFPGMPCGIMDQYISTLGRRDHALLIDCRSLESTQIPFDLDDAVILVTNSNVKHQLTGSEYPQRRAQCQKAAEVLGFKSLREANLGNLEELKHKNCDKLVVMRAEHVIKEIQRTVEVAKLLPQKDLKRVGQLLYESHASMSSLMEVSCPELDQLVDIISSAPGVFGARMTGGGFGGCVVTLVKKRATENLKRTIMKEYKGSPTFFVCQPSDGARVVKLYV